VLAIEHARDNTDFYGSRYRSRRLVWEVVSAEEGEDFYEVRLSYRPTGRFRGTPGVEQFTIDKTGGVRIRQILDEPVSKGLPRWPIALAGLVAIAVVIGVVALLAAADGAREEPAPLAAGELPATTPAAAPPGTPAQDSQETVAIGGTLLTGAQVQCMSEAIGDVAFREISSEVRQPTQDELDRFESCVPGGILQALQEPASVPTRSAVPVPAPAPAPTATPRPIAIAPTPISGGGLQRGGTISGRVTDADTGLPVAGVNVAADLDEGGGYSDVRTEADGTYTLIGLARGTYRVWANTDDQRYVEQYYSDKLPWEDADLVAISGPEDVQGIDFPLKRAAIISGTVFDDETGLPIRDVNVSVDFPNGGAYRDTVTDFQGRYTIAGLAPGTYVVTARAEDQGYVRNHYNHKARQELADLVAVGGQEEATGIDFGLALGATITDRVFDDETGLPIRDVNVNADLPEGGFGVGAGTDAEGRYTIKGLAAGRYVVSVRPKDSRETEGYVEEFYRDRLRWENADLVTVGEREQVRDINFGLGVGATISGAVMDSQTGLPIPDVDVQADVDQGGAYANTRTDASGAYSLRGLAPGRYRVWVGATDRGYVEEFYSERSRWENADLVVIGGREDVTGIDFGLALGAIISGRVTDADTGLPISGADVQKDADEGGFHSSTRTDTDGRYALPGVAPGRYRVWVDARNEGYAQQYYSQGPSWDDADPVTIRGQEEVTGVDFTLGRGATISGRVLDSETGLPIADVNVSADLDEGGAYNDLRTDAEGRYAFRGLAPGRYRIWANAGGRGYVEEFYNDELSSDNADLVTVREREEITGIDFGLAPGGNITGRVVDGATGLPIAGMDVRASLDGNDFSWTTTDSDGNYTLRAVPDGSVEVTVSGQGYLEQRKTVTMSGAGEVRLDF
jgi:protocatechuate 3,4-dioxygenase beta subunit